MISQRISRQRSNQVAPAPCTVTLRLARRPNYCLSVKIIWGDKTFNINSYLAHPSRVYGDSYDGLNSQPRQRLKIIIRERLLFQPFTAEALCAPNIQIA